MQLCGTFLKLDLELELKLEWLKKVSKTLGGLVYFATYSSGGRSSPEDYIAKYTSAPRVFDTTEGEIKNFCVDTTEGEIKNFWHKSS